MACAGTIVPSTILLQITGLSLTLIDGARQRPSPSGWRVQSTLIEDQRGNTSRKGLLQKEPVLEADPTLIYGLYSSFWIDTSQYLGYSSSEDGLERFANEDAIILYFLIHRP